MSRHGKPHKNHEISHGMAENANNAVSHETLEFLASWADLYDHPENWLHVCKQWADHLSNEQTMARATPLLDRVVLYSNKSEDHVHQLRQEKARHCGEFARELALIVNQKGVIEHIGDEASDTLGFSVGDTVEDALTQPFADLVKLATGGNPSPLLTEIVGRDGIRRLANVKAKADVTYTGSLILSLCHVFLSSDVERYIRKKLSLTSAEYDILTRTIRRQSVTTIAEKRQSSVNTVRTHVNNIIKKFGCRSLNDVMVRTLEIIAYHDERRTLTLDYVGEFFPTARNSRIERLRSNGAQIEYWRYGDATLEPLVLLHSVEYGFFPSPEFLSAAAAAGYCVYSPLRPGFGRSTPVASIREAAALMDEFLTVLQLRRATLVSFTNAAPTALRLVEISNRIERCVFANFALNAAHKIDNVEPRWVKGLLDLGLGSKQRFSFAYRLTVNVLKAVGHERFFTSIYEGCNEDIAYVAAFSEDYRKNADLVRTADPEAIRLDLINSFKSTAWVDEIVKRHKRKIAVICGQTIKSVPAALAQEQARQYGVSYRQIDDAGLNCAFQKPQAFFAAMAASAR